MMRRSLLSLIISLVVLSCGEPNGPGLGKQDDPSLAMVGTWRLQTVNGQALPFTLPPEDVDKLELTGETITLIAPGRVTMVTTFRVTDGRDLSSESVPDAGTYTVDGSTVSFKFDSDGSTPKATVNGDIMTLDDIGLTFVYRRD